MSRKSPPDSNNGFDDVIGVALLAAALLLLVAQLSFDRYDLSFFKDPQTSRCIIGSGRSALIWRGVCFFPWVWWDTFCRCCLRCLGGVPVEFSGLPARTFALVGAVVGGAGVVAHRPALPVGQGWLAGKFCESIGSQSAGGWLGFMTYGQTPHYEYGFCLFGKVGATIVYATLCLISLLFLTNFQLGKWIRQLLQKEPAAAEPESAEEAALERRARDLERQAEKIAGRSRPVRSGRGFAAGAGADRSRFERAAGQTYRPRPRSWIYRNRLRQ